MFKIVTFNIWGIFGPEVEKRWAYASEALADLEADILCLQEATDKNLLDRLAKKVERKIIHSDCEETGLAVLSNLKADESQLVPYKTHSPLEDYIRKFIWVNFTFEKKRFILTNTHLSWKLDDDASRSNQAQELTAFAAGQPLPAVLCGDFNCDYMNGPLDALSQKGFLDLMKGMADEKRPTWDNKNLHIQIHEVEFPDRRLDLILADPAFQKLFALQDCRIALNTPNKEGLFPSAMSQETKNPSTQFL